MHVNLLYTGFISGSKSANEQNTEEKSFPFLVLQSQGYNVCIQDLSVDLIKSKIQPTKGQKYNL